MDVSPHVWTFRPTMDISPHGDSPIEISPRGRGAKRLRANRHGAKRPYMGRTVSGVKRRKGEASSLNVFKTRLGMIRNTRMGYFMD